MKTSGLLLVCAIAAFLPAQFLPADPITGYFGFAGTVQLNSTDVNTATSALLNQTNFVTGTSGAFTNIAEFTQMTFTPLAWSFDSGPMTNFWSVGGFTFNLTSSSIFLPSFPGFVNCMLTGTVTGNGFDRTAFNGSCSMQGPSVNDSTLFTESFSFAAVSAPPNLIIVPNGLSSLTLLWPNNPYFNYTLQQSCDPTTTNWVTSSFTVTNGFGTNFCAISPLTTNLFFRLSQ